MSDEKTKLSLAEIPVPQLGKRAPPPPPKKKNNKQTVERFEHCFEAMIKLVKQLVFKGNSTENQLPLLNNRDDIKLVQTALGPEPSDEDRMVGEVSVLTYWKFFRAGASSITLFVLLWVMSSGSCK